MNTNLQKIWFLGLAVLSMLTILAGLGLNAAFAAGVWYVAPGGNDGNACTSSAAPCASINGALAKPGFAAGDTIKVAVGSYTGSGTQVVLINKSVILSGGWDASFSSETGSSTIDGQNARRGITANSGTTTLERFTVEKGYHLTEGGGIYAGVNATVNIHDSIIQDNLSDWGGGGILNTGTMSLNHSTVRGNMLGDSGMGGGGIYNSGGTMKIENSTINDNRISNIYSPGVQGSAMLNSGTAEIENSTISNNGPAVALMALNGITHLVHVTVNNNTGEGINNAFGGTFTLSNTVVANHQNGDCVHDNGLSSLGFNLIENNVNCPLAASDIVNHDPFLAPLADNGGPTLTNALLGGSQAINAIPPANCPFASDQRGVIRPQSTNCDMGAYEATGSEPTPTSSLTPTPTKTFTPTWTPTRTFTPTRTNTPTPSATPMPVIVQRMIIQESFEGAFPNAGWDVTGHWGKSNCNASAGAYSAWIEGTSGLSCGNNYHDSEVGWMVFGPFSLSDALGANLDYALWLNSEYGYDYFFVGASLDGVNFYGNAFTGHTVEGDLFTRPHALNLDQAGDKRGERVQLEGWSNARAPSGTNADWWYTNLDLNNVYQLGNLSGQPQVWIGFAWQSDVYLALPEGAYVDDLRLTKQVLVTKPAKPKMKAPANKSTVVKRRVLLDWDSAARAVTYNIKLRKDSRNGETVLTRVGWTVTELKTKRLERGKTYFWRVWACNEAGCQPGKWWSFTVRE